MADDDRGDQLAPIDFGRVFSAWTLEPLPILVVLLAAGVYVLGVRALVRRGDHWSGWRTLSFVVAGCGALLVATSSSLATYDTTLLSLHMAQHMVLSMVAPVFLALGAPVTLALRTLPGRPRGMLLSALHSRLARAVSFPPVAFALFVASPWVLYFSGWYEATLRSAPLHGLLHLHFVVVGCLFFWPLLGLDPVPGRVAYPFRMLTVFATLPFHAFLGVTIMSMDTLIGGDWYLSLGRLWPPSPAEDQHIAGGILWASGDIVGLVFFAVLFVQWVRESQREAERVDRRLDREEASRT
ncbi:MAG: cytochrome c oxidase assembly protein [Nocardioidaceae bacterium]|nr:cytochrome c oxidase assembly protein [Nocardioidaceae bacterium]